ncbi:uncharacterized protein BT62DRAFT_922383 [Guyanagaster necrorhizus]|uniref:Uncharacterized protein n=1 Tax=Guyanagaster necrorhizus TaxID=856835 RepID=A0A9P7VMH3_9AGAR|nr:uncharacterized protein BT62DRAFT_922383 [Guyanagaster necrorhizus MCA 3950]KAG7442661.1 hypothetical protein BT62DRAFT_922383 [Guyanagaster necrorhizus MCA 3950]
MLQVLSNVSVLPTAALDAEGDTLADTAALEDTAERLVLDTLDMVILDGSEKVVEGVKRLVVSIEVDRVERLVVATEVDKVKLPDEEIDDVDETVLSVELLLALSDEDLDTGPGPPDIGIAVVVDGRGSKLVELHGGSTDSVDVGSTSLSLVEMGSMVNVCAATQAADASNTSANFMMVEGWPAS